MKYLFQSSKCLIVTFLIFFFLTTTFLSFYILTLDKYQCSSPDAVVLEPSAASTSLDSLNISHNLAVLVPFRDRFDELLSFIPHMNKFLTKQSVKHQFFILNQVDNLRFNRASLINVGFKLIRKKFDYIAIHDVDLLPLRDELKYSYPSKGVFHVSSPELHPKYHYPTFLGGVLLLRREDFELVNGMSNRYWGWGLEDDEFYTRLKDAGIPVNRPIGVPTGKNNTFLHIHNKDHRRRDMRKCFSQLAVTRKRDRVTGLHDVKYHVNSTVAMSIEGVNLTVVNIVLVCDNVLTPWCLCDTGKAR